MCHTRGIMNRHDSVSSRGFRWDTGMKTNEHSWASVLVTDQKKHAHQWPLMGIRMKTTQKTRKAVRHLTSYTATQTPWNKWPDVTTMGMNMNLHMGDLWHPLEWACTYITQGRFHPPLHLFLNFHLCNMLIRVLYNKHRYRYRYLPVNKIPIFFFYITTT